MKISTPFTFLKSAIALVFLFVCLASCSEDDPAETKVSFITKATPESTNVTISAEASLNRGTLQEKGFLFSETPGITTDNTVWIICGNSESPRFALVKFDLEPHTAYYFKPYVIVSGKTFLGDEEMVTTLAEEEE